MPAISIRPKVAARRADDVDIRLSNGGRTVLADISGNTWTRARLRRLEAHMQGQADKRARIPTDPADVDFEATDAELLARYGGRRFYSDDRTEFIDRSTLITVVFDRPDMNLEGGGVMDKDLIITTTQVR